MVSCGLFGAKGMIWFSITLPNPWRRLIRLCGMLCWIMVVLSGKIHWWIPKRLRMLLIRMCSMNWIWFDVLNGLIGTRSNLVGMWKVQPWMDMISWSPLHPFFSPRGGCIGSLAIDFFFNGCAPSQKKKRKEKEKERLLFHVSSLWNETPIHEI